MNKEQAKKQIEELKAKLKELEDNIKPNDNPLAYERKPYGKIYHTIGAVGGVYHAVETAHDADYERFAYGNYKQTFGQAKRHDEYTRTLNRLLCIADELNEGWKPNWDDSEGEKKWYIYYDHPLRDFSVWRCAHASENRVYFKTKELAEAAIKRLDERDKKVLKGLV